jgi:hypothetical protein
MDKIKSISESIRYRQGEVNVTVEFIEGKLFNIEIYSYIGSIQRGMIYGKTSFDCLQEILMDIGSEIAERA